MTIRKDFTQQELIEWYRLILQVNNGYHMEKVDKERIIQLNFRIMEACHDIHNGISNK